MGQLLLFIVVALVVASIVFGVTVMVGGGDPGLTPVEPDGRALPLPSDRPLGEEDVVATKFDTALRGYRMSQVDQALQRAAYDIGYKGELIGVLEAEVAALRDGRIADADVLRRAREAAVAPPADDPVPAGLPDDPEAVAADLPRTAPAQAASPADPSARAGSPADPAARAGSLADSERVDSERAGSERAARPGDDERAGEPAAGENAGGAKKAEDSAPVERR